MVTVTAKWLWLIVFLAEQPPQLLRECGYILVHRMIAFDSGWFVPTDSLPP